MPVVSARNHWPSSLTIASPSVASITPLLSLSNRTRTTEPGSPVPDKPELVGAEIVGEAGGNVSI